MWIEIILLFKLSDIVKEPSTYVTLIGMALTYVITKKKTEADIAKRRIEVADQELDVEIKEKKYEADRYSKLLNRVVDNEKIIEELTLQVQGLSRKLLEATNKNKELLAELNLYKTITK